MERRQFLAASIATSAAALAGSAAAQVPPPVQRQFYQLRRYNLITGPQLQLTEPSSSRTSPWLLPEWFDPKGRRSALASSPVQPKGLE